MIGEPVILIAGTKYYSAVSAVAMTGLSMRQLLNLTVEGEITRYGSPRKVMYSYEEINGFIEKALQHEGLAHQERTLSEIWKACKAYRVYLKRRQRETTE